MLSGGSGSGTLLESHHSVDYSGSLGLDGHVRCYAGGRKVASAGFDLSGDIDGDVIKFDLPYLDDVSIHLP